MKDLNSYLTDKSFVLTPVVVGFLIRDNQVLLGERKKVSNDLGQNLFSGIGGKLEPGENSMQALVREVDEEIGVEVEDFQHMGSVKFIFPHKPVESKWSQVTDVYVVRVWKGEPKETEAIAPKWFPLDSVPWERMWPDAAYWLPQVLAGLAIEAAFLYDENKQVVEYSLRLKR